jgi:hypothetical protein
MAGVTAPPSTAIPPALATQRALLPQIHQALLTEAHL